jgi:hypothetical protein
VVVFVVEIAASGSVFVVIVSAVLAVGLKVPVAEGESVAVVKAAQVLQHFE